MKMSVLSLGVFLAASLSAGQALANPPLPSDPVEPAPLCTVIQRTDHSGSGCGTMPPTWDDWASGECAYYCSDKGGQQGTMNASCTHPPTVWSWTCCCAGGEAGGSGDPEQDEDPTLWP